MKEGKKGLSRREMLTLTGVTIAGGSLGLKGSEAAYSDEIETDESPPQKARKTGGTTPVVVPNGATLAWKIIDDVKVFHLIAEEVEHEFAPGLKVKCWGYNRSIHGPVIEAVEGDRVRIFVTNHLPAPTTVHWHGLLLPNGMDGVGGLTQKAIKPGETFKYEFTLKQNGTLMYHSHHDEMIQIALGLTGLFIIHPRDPVEPVADRDFAILLHEWRVDAGTSRPNPIEMTEFNILTMNGKSFPGTAPLVVKTGERVRIRIGNLSPMDSHPIHLHGYRFTITETDGGRIPESARWPETTVLVPVGSTRTIEFVANEPGDWALHCHMTHHLMNQMGHGIPNMIGVKESSIDHKVQPLLPDYMTMGGTGMAEMGAMEMPIPENSIPMKGGYGKHDFITMGGMFTVLKVRDTLENYDDPGWYTNPPDTLSLPASEAELEKNGIQVKRRQ